MGVTPEEAEVLWIYKLRYKFLDEVTHGDRSVSYLPLLRMSRAALAYALVRSEALKRHDCIRVVDNALGDIESKQLRLSRSELSDVAMYRCAEDCLMMMLEIDA